MDAFLELGLERRLGLSPEEVQSAFRERGRAAHPDGGGEAAEFERVQEARRVLLEPALRLRHWLELEGVEGSLRGAISTDLMDVFCGVGAILQQADEVLRAKENAGTALARAMLEGRVQECREKLEDLGEGLEGAVAERVGLFGGIEAGEGEGWRTARELAFLEKWRGQVRERYGSLW